MVQESLVLVGEFNKCEIIATQIESRIINFIPSLRLKFVIYMRI